MKYGADIIRVFGKEKPDNVKITISSKFQLLIIIAFCFITRLPQIFSSNMMLDGDECVVGLMAKHLITGEEFPFYFYGQKYGFSLIEISTTGLFYLLFGISDISVKSAMLFLWTIGIIFFFRALCNFDSKKTLLPFVLTLLFVVVPAWGIWALKARGGYITSFLSTSLVIFILSKNGVSLKYWVIGILAILFLLIFESQPLWIPGVFFIIVYYFSKMRHPWKIVLFCSIFLVGFVGLREYKKQLLSVWTPQGVTFKTDLIGNVLKLPENVFHSLTGNYYYTTFFKSGFFINVVSFSLTCLVFGTIIYTAYYIIKNKNYNSILTFTLLAQLATLLYFIFMIEIHFRYLLPLTGFFILNSYFLLKVLKPSKLITSVVIVLCVLGFISQFTFIDYQFQNFQKKEIIKLTRYLDKNGIRSTFSMDPLLQWQIIYYSKEKINSRFIGVIDRYPKYANSVNNDLVDPAKKVAIVGFYSQLSQNRQPNLITFGGQYFAFIEPSYEELINIGFRFK